MEKKDTLYYRFANIVLIVSTCLLSSCFGTKNLVVKQRGMPRYDYVGDTLDGWALVRQDSLWGYVSQDGKRTIEPAFLWATDFAGGMVLIQDKHGYRYMNNEGKLIRWIKAGHAYPFTEGLAPIEKKGKWGYINSKGKKVIKPQFDWAMPFHENRAAVSIGLKKGYINPNGELIIPAIYQETHAFKKGVAIVRKDLQFGLIDTLGNFLLPNQYDEIKVWENDFYRLGMFTPATGRVSTFGLADKNGQLMLDTLYSYIDLQKDNQYIRVKKDSLYGLFDRQGKVIVPLEYTYLGDVWDTKFMAAEKSGDWGFLDTQGKVLLPFKYKPSISAADGRIWVRKDSVYILMDYQFREIKRFSKYDRVYPFSNGYTTVRMKEASDFSGNLYGYIDRDGNEVIAPQYNGGAGDVNPYGISVIGNKKYGFVEEYLFNIGEGKLVDGQHYSDLKLFGQLLFNNYGVFLSPKTGKPIADFPYQSIEPLEGDRKDLATARREGKEGLIDTALTELLPLEYEDIGSFYNGRMKIKKGDRWGYIDERFRIRIPMVYDDAYYFRYPMLTEVSQNRKRGIIDRYGKEIIPLSYTQISFDYACDRIYADKGNDGIDIYNREGRLLLASDFGYIGLYGRKNYVTYRRNGKLGFMDYDFQVLYEPEFDGAGDFYNGLAWVRKAEKGGYINDRFELVISIQFDHFQPFVAGFAKVQKDGREYYINTKGEETILTGIQLKERDIEMKRRGWD